MPELPAFVKRALRKAGRPILPPSRALSSNIGALYNEYWACASEPGWIDSPRGKWVDFQLDWYENRADRWTE
jgi:hypothetical protein